MGGRDEVLRRQSRRTKFKNRDMDFSLNLALGVSQIVGMSPGEVLAVASSVKDGDPRSWRESFYLQGGYLSGRAECFAREGNLQAGAHSAFGAAYARRFALHFEEPGGQAWETAVIEMEREFLQGVKLGGVPLRAISVPFEGGTLPGYFLEIDDEPRPTVLVVGGGDTFREDLYYFGGAPGWRRGYNVLMVDLPGQGNNPGAGFVFRHDASSAIAACLDWLEDHAIAHDPRIAAFGLSGGGYFTAQAVATDDRIRAWIASTPITDIALVFSREMGGASSAPGWFVNTAARLRGRANAVVDVSLKKYAWQFGTPDFAEVLARVPVEAPRVSMESLTCPSLFLVGDGDAAELGRQTEELARVMEAHGHDVTLRHFTKEEGDAHCQVNNLKLAHLVIFDWLDRRFAENSPPKAEHLHQ